MCVEMLLYSAIWNNGSRSFKEVDCKILSDGGVSIKHKVLWYCIVTICTLQLALVDSKKLLDLKSSEIEHFNLTLKFSVKPPSDEGPKSKARMTSSSSGEEKIDDSKTTGRTKVLVTNLPKNVDEEYIEMFFENTRLWKGGDVTGVEYNESKKSAVITFQDSSGEVDA